MRCMRSHAYDKQQRCRGARHGAKNSTTLGIWLPSTVFPNRCGSTSFTLPDAEYSASAPRCWLSRARQHNSTAAASLML